VDVWTYPDPALLGVNVRTTDVTGYGVEALDGSIGKIDEATYDTGSSYLIIDTGSWFTAGNKVMLPAGVVPASHHRRREGVCQPHERRDQERA
jgi:hypothetical protein